MNHRPAPARLKSTLLGAFLGLAGLLPVGAPCAEADGLALTEAFSGDVGLALVRSGAAAQGVPGHTNVLPYLNFEQGRLFARIDTFGIKTLPLGAGHLELLGQVRSDGYHGGGWSARKDPVPLGLGTLQITPVGAFGVNVLHDFGASGGTLVQARYLAELPLGRITLYPELGLERQSSGYTRYYLGTTAADAAAAGRAYQPGAALNPYVGGLIELPVSGPWVLNLYLRRVFTDRSLANSPLAGPGHRDTALLALAWRY